jgi:TM2 domain-containing membrane protein YozV
MHPGSAHALVSRRNYGVAVSLAAVFGVLGIHHFYLGRPLPGLLDLGITLAAIYLIATGEIAWGLLLLLVDFAHSQYETIRLITGRYLDGDGAVVAHPGQIVSRRDP